MIVIVNGASDVGQADVAAALVERFGDAVLVAPELDRLREHWRDGKRCFLVPAVFETWRSLRTFRRELAALDSTSYAFRLLRKETELDSHGIAVQRRQDQEALRGDVGLPVPDMGVSAAAEFIWDDIHEPIALEPWNEEWTFSFALERNAILEGLGERALSVEHVGSTAVEGLWAKPIVDIGLAIPSLESTEEYLPSLRELGYHFLDYPTNIDRYFFKKGRPRTHHLHVGTLDSEWMGLQVRFRDLLRSREDLRERYLALKRELEAEYSSDRARYSDSKGAFVRDALSRG